MNKKEAIEKFVEARFSAIPTEWVQIVAEQKGLEIYAWPMWGTMWFVDSIWGKDLMERSKTVERCDKHEEYDSECEKCQDFDEELEGCNTIIDKTGHSTAAVIYEIEGEYLIGVHGAGWNFYNGVWDKIYDLLDIRWHENNDLSEKQLGELLSSDDETIKRNALSILKRLQNIKAIKDGWDKSPLP